MTRSDVSSADEAASTSLVSHAPVRVLLHAGGLLQDATLPNQTAGRATAVMAPKCAGMTRLDAETHAHDMRSSVMFSSVASLLGSGGQANYCAANGWLDAFARVASSQGRAATSVQWGAWSGGGGKAANDAGTINRMERLGVGVLSPEQGLGALEVITRSAGHSVVAANPFIWDRFLRSMKPVPAFFGEFAHLAAADPVASAPRPTASSSSKAAPGALALAVSEVEAKVAGCVRDILGTDVAANEPLIDAGLDSLGAVELRDAVNAAVGMELPSTVVFDYPSVGAMSGFIVSQMHPAAEADAAAHAGAVDQPIATRGGVQREMIGVVGSSSHTPRDALRADGAVDAITRVPLARWSLDASDDAQVQARFGSFAADVEMFDSDLFNVSSTEGVLLDPQQRMLLEAAWEAKAGTCEASIAAERSGVTVGISSNEYARMADVVSAYTATGGALSVACGRMSYTFGMQGISLSVDTACSSSLVGSHIAITSIASGESDSVTSCGVNVTLNPLTSEMFSKAGMLSKDGRCKTLDSSADGYVRAEACVALELRALAGRRGRRRCSTREPWSRPPSTRTGAPAPSPPPTAPPSNAPFAAPCARRGWIPAPSTVSRCTAPGPLSAIPSRWAPPTPCSWSTPRRRRARSSHPLGDEILRGPHRARRRCGWAASRRAGGRCTQRATHPASQRHQPAPRQPHAQGGVRGGRRHGAPQAAHRRRRAAPPHRPTQRGVSSFAFQGTNAHVMVAAPASTAAAAVAQRGRAALWTRERLWLAAPRHPLVQSAALTTASPAVRFKACIAVDHQAYLWDHRVAGRGLLPAAAFLEVGTSALRLIHDAPAAVCGAAITSPLVLPSAGTSLWWCAQSTRTPVISRLPPP